MRHLLFKAVMLCHVLALVPVVNGQRQHQQHRSNQGKADSPLPAVDILTGAAKVGGVDVKGHVDQVAASQHAENQPGATRVYLKRLFSPEVLPNAILAIIGFVGVIYAYRTVEANRKSAEAALLNAKAFINAERPWLVVVVEPVIGPPGGFNVSVKNTGRSPAIVLSAQMACAAVKDVSYLPPEAVYGQGSMVEDRMVIQGERVWIEWFDSKIFKKFLGNNFRLLPGEGQMFVFGKVRYRGLSNPDVSLIHETRWIALYQGPSGHEGPSVFQIEGVGVTSEYERYT